MVNGPRAPLHLALLQTAPALGDIAANVAAIEAAAQGADLIVTPELSLTGYDVRDAVHDLALAIESGAAPPPLLAPLARENAPETIVGLVEASSEGIPYNSAILLGGGRIRHVHRKIYLPTYGLFDEGRYFGKGKTLETFELAGGWRAAMLVCEDLWHPALTYLAAMSSADLLIVPAAAPGRGVVEGGQEGTAFASSRAWNELVSVTARTYGVYVVLSNRVGVDDGVTFAGGSRIVGPDGAVLVGASDSEEQRIETVLEPAERARARRPFAHLRDEDPRFLVSALEQVGAV
jgi:predicted amidohydrolase